MSRRPRGRNGPVTQTAGAHPEPGELLGPYRIVRRLGFGGMGVVFEALDGTLNRPVALKVISSHYADDATNRSRFVHEAQAQASVRSPHVVTVYAHGEIEGRLYIATELVDAGDLGRLVQEHGVPPLATALDIIAQVASGLGDAHEAGLVHRDIKPANVLLRRREHGLRAYLADFGIARQVGAGSGLTVVGGTVGTPSYMAPELHTGGRAGVESDIYSLGCLLWAAITGAAPYAGTSDYQIVSAHLEQPIPQLRSGTPAADLVNRVLLRSLAKRPDARYAGAAAMSRDLREAAALAERSGETAVPMGRAASSPGRGRRRRRFALLVGVAALVAVAGAGAALALSGDDEEPAGAAVPAPDPTSGGAADRDRAVASLATALRSQPLVTDSIATCVAEGWIDGVGLGRMAAAGFFDTTWSYVDQPQESITPEMQGVLAQTITACTLADPGPAQAS